MRYAVILAGGGGTRLWPASRRRHPKQLLALGSRPGETLLAATVRRLGSVIPPARVLIVTGRDLLEGVALAVPGVPAENLIGEPVGRNTAAAIGLAAVHLAQRDPDAVMAVLPADHHIGDEDAFRDVVEEAFLFAEGRNAIVTVGLKPTRPETGFGYLQLGPPVTNAVRARVVLRFVEKPVRATAEEYLRSGDYLWNGGMFFFGAARILDDIKRHLPATHAALAEIAGVLHAKGAAAAAHETDRVYPALPSVSIDHGVMEKTAGILTLPGDFGWNDVGAWPALAEVRAADADGNVTAGTVITHDAHDNIALTDDGKLIALVGVEGLVVVQAGNAVLVMPRDRAQDVKEIVAQLEKRKLDGYL